MARKPTRPSSGHTILVVDDQGEVLESLQNLLEREGHRVLTASSAERALEILKAEEIHLLLVDYFMPRTTGEELVREIRKFDPYVQITLQTGYSGEKPATKMIAELDIQGYHDKADGPEKLLLWVRVGLKTQRLIAELRERERRQGELVANVSHEFRTPLNIVGGYTEMLISGAFGSLPEPAARPLNALLRASENLNELVTSFLTYARVEAGVMRVNCETIAINHLVAELQGFAAVLLDEKNVNFAVDLKDAPHTISTDPFKLRIVLRNLITNAVKFTSNGTICLRITTDGSSVRCAVRDTGSGIAPEDQQVVFEPFRQLDSSLTRNHGGTGLGLALSRKLAQLLGGDIELESTLGTGSTFTLVLPNAEPQGNAKDVAPDLIECAASPASAHAA